MHLIFLGKTFTLMLHFQKWRNINHLLSTRTDMLSGCLSPVVSFWFISGWVQKILTSHIFQGWELQKNPEDLRGPMRLLWGCWQPHEGSPGLLKALKIKELNSWNSEPSRTLKNPKNRTPHHLHIPDKKVIWITPWVGMTSRRTRRFNFY